MDMTNIRQTACKATISRAETAVAEASLLTKHQALNAAGEHWMTAEVIGLDTEFVRERTFRARPGLIQISDGAAVWLADPVTLPEMSPLGQLLADTRIIKVLHSVGEDLEVLEQVSGALPEPLFDTQIAAAMLGMPLQCRYEHLVEETFGAHLPGGKARNDWCRRPLDPALLEYAAQDVIWLPRLCRHLTEQLEFRGRLEWLEEDCGRLVDSARRKLQPPALSRVKGAGRLPDEMLALLEPLAEWREQQAAERDLPRRFVLSDEALIALAEAAAGKGAGPAISALKPGMRHRHGDRLAELIETADRDAFQRPVWLNAMDNDQREQVRLAQSAVRDLSEELKVEPALIASKKELTRIVRGERPMWLDGWRGKLLIERLEAASVNIPAA
jgi:ribonuclease D